MPRLGKFVVLAGPNGAGKTRLLRLVQRLGEEMGMGRARALEEVQGIEREFARLSQRLNELRSEGRSDSDEDVVNHLNDIANTRYNEQIRLARVALFDAVRTPGESGYSVVTFQLASLGITNAEQVSSQQTRQFRSDLESTPGVRDSSARTPAYIKQVLMEAFIASHPERAGSSDRVVAAARLIEILEQFLGKGVAPKYEDDGQLSLFGRRDYEAALSDGQKVLLHLAAAIHGQGKALSDVILFFDEPENHLHPAALNFVLDRLASISESGQIWIATHSVPLVAHLYNLDPRSIWYMQDGTVSSAGRRPERVISGLLGGENGRREVHDFTLLPDRMASGRFLAECLLPPGVVGPDINDPQLRSIANFLHGKFATQGRPVRLLDFGAGKARLLSNLAAGRDSSSTSSLESLLDYYAYDESDEHAEVCKNEIAASYNEGKARYFNDMASLRAHMDKQTVDIVVLCNVLHEIEPRQWTELLGASGSLTELLSPEGGVLILEDSEISAGELAHSYGFLLLKSAELKALFQWTEEDLQDRRVIRESPAEAKYADRLFLYWCERPVVERVTSSSRHVAIETLAKSSKEQMAHLASQQNKDFRSGHLYALAAQSYANASLWLQDN